MVKLFPLGMMLFGVGISFLTSVYILSSVFSLLQQIVFEIVGVMILYVGSRVIEISLKTGGII